MKIQYDKDILF